MTTFAQRDLFGGAITVQLPQDYIDSSTIRQIPDHQEVFLSRTTLTSVIFEINQYVPQPTDTAAAHYHINDIVSPPDHLSDPTPTPVTVHLAAPSMKEFPASAIEATIIGLEPDKAAAAATTNNSGVLPASWSSHAQSTPMKEVCTKIYQLVIRMAKHSTDLCVRINVPLKELIHDAAKTVAEEAFAKQIMQTIVQSLDVREFGLFGEE